MSACRICGNREGNRTHQVREMMYGMDERFDYLECSACGCLQIAQVPEDLGRYYPADYWQFQKDRHRFAPDPWLTRLARHQRAKYWLFHRRNITGRLLASGRLQPRYFG